jgi:hypothetical protein
MGSRGDTSMLVAGGAAPIGVVCCALGPAAIIGTLTTLTVGAVLGWVAAVSSPSPS